MARGTGRIVAVSANMAGNKPLQLVEVAVADDQDRPDIRIEIRGHLKPSDVVRRLRELSLELNRMSIRPNKTPR